MSVSQQQRGPQGPAAAGSVFSRLFSHQQTSTGSTKFVDQLLDFPPREQLRLILAFLLKCEVSILRHVLADAKIRTRSSEEPRKAWRREKTAFVNIPPAGAGSRSSRRQPLFTPSGRQQPEFRDSREPAASEREEPDGSCDHSAETPSSSSDVSSAADLVHVVLPGRSSRNATGRASGPGYAASCSNPSRPSPSPSYIASEGAGSYNSAASHHGRSLKSRLAHSMVKFRNGGRNRRQRRWDQQHKEGTSKEGFQHGSAPTTPSDRWFAKSFEDLTQGWVLVLSEEEVLSLNSPGLPAETEEGKKAWRRGMLDDRRSEASPGSLRPRLAEGDPGDASTLRQLVYEFGIPTKRRGKLWQQFCGGSREDLRALDTSYRDVYRTQAEAVTTCIPDYVLRQIEVDIPRTLPKALTSDAQQAALRRILRAYCLHNPTESYCQSMNVIAGVLVFLFFREQGEGVSSLCGEAEDGDVGEQDGPLTEGAIFALFVCLLNRLTPHYHSATLKGLMVDVNVLEKLMQELCPKFLRKVQSQGLDLLFFAVDPFMCLFGHSLPLPVLIRCWDVLLLEGNAALFALFIALCALTDKEQDSLYPQRAAPSEFLINRWAKDVRELGAVDVDAILVKTRAYLDTGAITREKILLLRKQDGNYGSVGGESSGNAWNEGGIGKQGVRTQLDDLQQAATRLLSGFTVT